MSYTLNVIIFLNIFDETVSEEMNVKVPNASVKVRCLEATSLGWHK